jgi:ABC-type lipoprotein export system ATPase subunit
MASNMTVLEMRDVTKSYVAAEGVEPVHVLQQVNLLLGQGESLAVVGPSGSGKSTLLNLMGTLDRPTRGQVLLEGNDLSQVAEPALAAIRNRRIGFIFQAHYLLPQCSVLENVLVPTLVCEDADLRASAEERARRLLDKVGLRDRLGHRPAQLSGGEKQRVAVVRALINEPRLLLADEPTGALDGASAQALGELLLNLNREEGITLVVVTHALALAGRMGKVVELREGRLKRDA